MDLKLNVGIKFVWVSKGRNFGADVMFYGSQDQDVCAIEEINITKKSHG